MKPKPGCLFWIALVAAVFAYDVPVSFLLNPCAVRTLRAAWGQGEAAFAASIGAATHQVLLLSRRGSQISRVKAVKISIAPLVIQDPAPGSGLVSPTRAMPDRTSGNATPRPARHPKEAPPGKKDESHLRFYSYHAEAGDTLKTIAQKFYGSYLYFPVILMHNPQIQTFEIEEGTDVSIIGNALEAIRLFRTHTVIDEGRIFWIYTARKNDTLEGIGKKFYQTRYVNNPLVNMNPESRIKPGEKIRILLN
ncbi:LysM peptidoglycan-binding domain-containing protein [Desulfatirhabdium butyrativorans]|uniref:LysM peptidoglycan-binding domain-containing protein n=1 Tax=Desulfatirhabdium butyrativorans TaxID=340467 RepID=UPI0003FC4572|nr:LysM peptidoglycan-binding domain-containing protein [Desulfatirhabdium butyrativorans]